MLAFSLLSTIIHNKENNRLLYVDIKLPARFELALEDSKSSVITATLRELNLSDLDSNQGLDPKKTPTLPTELPENDIDININNIYIILLYKKIYMLTRGLEPRTFGS